MLMLMLILLSSIVFISGIFNLLYEGNEDNVRELASAYSVSNNVDEMGFVDGSAIIQHHHGQRKLLADFSAWNISSVRLFRSDESIAVGYYNNSIYLLGGATYGYQLTEYNVMTNSMIDHGSSSIPVDTYGHAQFHTQINNTLYMIDPGGSVLSTYNLQTLEYQYGFGSNLLTNVEYMSCLTSFGNEYLFVVGGGSGGGRLNRLQIFSFFSNSWSFGASMKYKRKGLACNTHPRTKNLYVMGGDTLGGSYPTQIERIYIGGDIISESWTAFGSILPTTYPRSVVFGNDIILMGGMKSGKQLTYVQTLNCITNVVTQGAGTLSIGVNKHAAIIVNNIIYIFAGGRNTWQYSTLYPTLTPTYSPTEAPSISPSQAPTLPSISPTVSPTASPSLAPIITPTTSPTYHTLNPTQIPTDNPSNVPSLPSPAPTEHPSVPTLPPTNSPTLTPTYKQGFFSSITSTLLWSVVGGSLLIIIIVILIVLLTKRYKVKRDLEKKTMKIKHPMVVLLAIGQYEKNPNNPDIEGYLQDLDVDVDVNNLAKLFRDKLKYEIFPQFETYPKIDWTQKELITLLEVEAKLLSDNIDKRYDGLIVVVSSHGMDNSILTSDYKMISKDAIHRIFTTNYPKSRNVPRIFVFDCCDGDEQSKAIKAMKIDKLRNNNTGKCYSVKDISYEEKDSDNLWNLSDNNPDHKLVTVHAANLGFQSKMNSSDGSYLIHKFVTKVMDNLDNHRPQFLFEIMDEIQQELGKASKQLPIFMFNNGTRYIKFIENKNTSIQSEKHQEFGKGAQRVDGDMLSIQLEMTRNVDGDKETEIMLLEEWGLIEHWDIFKQFGWDDVKEWNELINSEKDLNQIFNLKRGHKIRFIKKVKIYHDKET